MSRNQNCRYQDKISECYPDINEAGLGERIVEAHNDRRGGTVKVAASLIDETVEIHAHFFKVRVHQYERFRPSLVEFRRKRLDVAGRAGYLFSR